MSRTWNRRPNWKGKGGGSEALRAKDVNLSAAAKRVKTEAGCASRTIPAIAAVTANTMPAVAVAESRLHPPEVLRLELADARERGLEFEHAWPFAVGRALVGVRGEERQHWIHALAATDVFWHHAYTGIEFDRCSRPIYPG